jgi:hypothetical protein
MSHRCPRFVDLSLNSAISPRFRRDSGRLAGDAVLIAPVSGQIPC